MGGGVNLFMYSIGLGLGLISFMCASCEMDVM